MVGRQISHYRIVGELGAGGMGRVYRAEDTLLGRPVALKFPHPELIRDRAARERFLREARIASVLDHPNIVVLYDVCDAEGDIFLAMQCIDGLSLRERLRAGSVPPAEALAIGRAVADALAHAHARRVVHRDVKPENVLLCRDGRVKVADFGLAWAPGESRLTAPSTVLGTPAYLAPEVIGGAAADARSDLYALGAVLYELCAGVPPFAADSPAALMYRIVHEPAPATPPAVPPEARRLIDALLAKSPEERPRSAVDVADALGCALQGKSSAAEPAATPARSIAVLPLANLTASPEDEYLCSGITEDLLTEILKIPDLRVASRSAVESSRTGADLGDLGRALGVATVLEGGVRRVGERIRVTARLARTDTGYQLWAERYDRSLEDVFEVQEDIARRIATALRVVFEPAGDATRLGRLARSPRAYDLRLKAMALHRRMEEADMRQAIALLEQALSEDPDFALARADLAECCVQMVCKAWETDPVWLERAGTQVERALELAPSLPEAFRARGHTWMHRSKPRLALRDFHVAADLDPRFAGAINSLAVTYLVLGDPSRAEIYARRARELDPQMSAAGINLAGALLYQNRFAEVPEVVQATLALDPPRHYRLRALEVLLLAHARGGNEPAARRVVEQIRRDEADPVARAVLALGAALLHDPTEARRRLADATLRDSPASIVHVTSAHAHALLGDREAALSALERALRLDVVALAEARSHPGLADLLRDPRFAELHALS